MSALAFVNTPSLPPITLTRPSSSHSRVSTPPSASPPTPRAVEYRSSPTSRSCPERAGTRAKLSSLRTPRSSRFPEGQREPKTAKRSGRMPCEWQLLVDNHAKASVGVQVRDGEARHTSGHEDSERLLRGHPGGLYCRRTFCGAHEADACARVFSPSTSSRYNTPPWFKRDIVPYIRWAQQHRHRAGVRDDALPNPPRLSTQGRSPRSPLCKSSPHTARMLTPDLQSPLVSRTTNIKEQPFSDFGTGHDRPRESITRLSRHSGFSPSASSILVALLEQVYFRHEYRD